VVEYANEPGCRSVALRRYFGDEDTTPCGRCDLCRASGVAAPERFPGRRGGDRRHHRDRRPWRGPRPDAAASAQGGGAGATPAVASDGADRRRRRRRRRGHGRQGFGTPPGPMVAPEAAAAPPAAPAFALPPLDPAADDLAAELGAPGLPPPPGAATAPVGDPPRPPGSHRRRRRRRRRGRGPRPEAGPRSGGPAGPSDPPA